MASRSHSRQAQEAVDLRHSHGEHLRRDCIHALDQGGKVLRCQVARPRVREGWLAAAVPILVFVLAPQNSRLDGIRGLTGIGERRS